VDCRFVDELHFTASLKTISPIAQR
jgi:hypothetical protein